MFEGEDPVSDHYASRDLTTNKPEPAGEKGLPFTPPQLISNDNGFARPKGHGHKSPLEKDRF